MPKQVKNIISSELGKLNLYDLYRILFYTFIGFILFFVINLGLQVYQLIQANTSNFDVLQMVRIAFLYAVDIAKYIALATGIGKWLSSAKSIIIKE